MAEIKVCATTQNLETVLRFVDVHLAAVGMDKAARIRAALAAEEIYVNIAHYAYGEKTGSAIVRCVTVAEMTGVMLEFIDSGKPFNPLDSKDPDITLPAGTRDIGGLGIYITRLIADKLEYRRENGKNHLAMWLRIQDC